MRFSSLKNSMRNLDWLAMRTIYIALLSTAIEPFFLVTFVMMIMPLQVLWACEVNDSIVLSVMVVAL
jgi:hypothetical protein